MKPAMALLLLPLVAACSHMSERPSDVAAEAAKAHTGSGETLVRNTLAEVEFETLFPGVGVHFIYGGIGLGVPTAQLGRIDAGLTFPAHTHSDDYNAVVIRGNFQHWEEGDADRGPVMTAGSTFFQGRNAPHFDSCLGPEQCLVYVTFANRADVTMAQ